MKCVECSKGFEAKTKNQKFCTSRCRTNYNARIYRKRHKEKINKASREYRKRNISKLREKWRKYPPISEIESICIHCGKKFKPHNKFHPQQKFCSKKCRANYNRRKYYWQNPEKERRKVRKYKNLENIIKQCKWCGKKFKPSKEKPWTQFCSIKCRNKHHNYIAYHRNPEKAKEKVKKYRQTEKGKQVHRDSVRHHTWARRKTIEQMDYILTNKDQQFIRERDNYQCQLCESTENISHDHIIPIKLGGLDIVDNVIVSCQKYNSSRQERNIFEWCESKGIEVPPKIIKLLKKQIKNGSIKLNTKTVPSSLYNLRKSLPKIVKIKECVYCRKKFKTMSRKKDYCSLNCRRKATYNRLSKKVGRTKIKGVYRICPTCSKKFEIGAVNQIYCSKKCWKPKISKCKSCGEEKEIYGNGMCRNCWKKDYLLRKNPPKAKKCKFCSKIFKTRIKNKIFCSNDCKVKYYSLHT